MIRSYATSDVGKVRELNEDYFSVSYPEDEIQLFVLADGMGGYNGGEIASQLAVNSVDVVIVIVSVPVYNLPFTLFLVDITRVSLLKSNSLGL